MKFVFASDSFKGSLTTQQTGQLLTRAAQEVFAGCECVSVPAADGGEGTTRTVVEACRGRIEKVPVHGPLLEREEAFYGVLSQDEAILEMAAASGLPMVPREKRNPLYTTTYGTGELLKAVLDAGYTRISIAVGGSATNDGGMGFARAMGVRFYDADKNELPGRGIDLEALSFIDLSGLDPRLKTAEITVMCDVTNPLCGNNGATYTFAAQKGADLATMDRLEKGMEHYRDIIKGQFGMDPDQYPGTGAAGGLGAALLYCCRASMKSGIETVLDLIHFDEVLKGADLVVTGEGKIDSQSARGKVVQGVSQRARRAGVPVVCLCGGLGRGYEALYESGVDSFMVTPDSPMSLDKAISDDQRLYYTAAVRMFQLLKVGSRFSAKP